MKIIKENSIPKTYLCVEYGNEEFLVDAESYDDAVEIAAMYGGTVIKELKITKLKIGGKDEEL